MATPKRLTDDGFELQLGTNHLAHFALTGLLLPSLLAAGGARVVTVSSGAHKAGRIDFDDLQSERAYQRWTAYSQSKLANLLFAFELGRRAEAAGLDLVSAAAHPGYAATELQAVGPRMAGSQAAGAHDEPAQRGDRPGGVAGRAAAALRGRDARRAQRRLLRSRRHHRAARLAAEGRRRRPRPATRSWRAACGRCRRS